MIRLDTLQFAPVTDLNDRFQVFREEYSVRVRESSVYDSVEQDVLILAWAWTIGGFAGDELQWIEHLVDVVSSEYDTHRRVDQRRRKFDREVLLDRLVEHAERQGTGSIEYLITHAPEEYQQLLTWKYVAGYTNAEIAAFLKKGVSTVELYVTRSYRAIRDNATTPNR